MIPTRDGSRLEPMVLCCPMCSVRDGVDTRLLMIELQTSARDPRRRARPHPRKHPPVMMLLRVTGKQLEDIREEFAKHGRSPRRNRWKSDRELVLDSLVP